MTINRSLGQNKYESYTEIGPVDGGKTAIRNLPLHSSGYDSITAESVAIAAGAAGTTGVTKTKFAPIVNSDYTRIGSKDSTSFAWVTGTCLTTQVAYRIDQTDAEQLAALSQGQYAIDYDTGRIRYCKKTTATSDTCNYSIRVQKVDTELTVEGITIDNVKVFSIDGTATNSKYGFAATDGMTADGTKHAPVMAGYDATNGKAQHLRQAKGDAAANPGYHLSVAGEVVDFNTAAGTDYTPAIGVMGSSASGAIPLELLVQNAAFGTAASGLAVFGKYMATPTTYDDGDACPILLDNQGRIVLSSDIEIGAVEIKNGLTDDRAEIVAPNSKDFDFGLHTIPARYMATPPTLTDTYSAPLLLDSTGKLSVTAANTEYADDGNGFTAATSKGVAIMGFATSDAVDSGDIGALRMTTSRNLGVDISEQSLTAVKVSATAAANAVNNPIFAAVGDGTTTAVVETSGTKKALNVNVTDGTNDMPTADAVGRSLYAAVGDGTTTAVVETSGTKKALNVNITDGTNDMPTMDAAARRGYIQLSDGTDDALVTGDKELYVATTERNKPAVANATNTSGAIALSAAPAAHFKLLAVTVHFNSAPTTSESLTITLNANDGAAYDTTLRAVNPSLTAATDIVYVPDGGELTCESGDAIDVAFANTDNKTYGARIVYQLL